LSNRIEEAAMPQLALYDNYTRSVRPFEPLVPGRVGLYTCGPTVYDHQHIGNHRTFLFEDGLRRVLRWNGYQVNHVMNITDVGHLTSDADTGEDKMERRSRAAGSSARELARVYTEAFVADMARLNIVQPTTLCRATEHIDDQIAFVVDLERKGFTYVTDDGVYFDTSRQAHYGHLARLDRSGLASGKRVAVGGKRSPTDFALWKFSPPGAQRQMEWPSPWGTGFPGWHIECSAMAQRYLGELFDIHCGGEDHIPVHHTNEIAQTEARSGTRLARYWLHGYFLLVKRADDRAGEGGAEDLKMARSSGDFLRVQALVDRGHEPLAFRYLCLTSHYRTQLSFSWSALAGAATALDRLRHAARALPEGGAPDADWKARFTGHINDDLGFPRALATAHEMLASGLEPGSKRATLLEMDTVLGLDLERGGGEAGEAVPGAISALAEARREARAAGDWAESDRLRGAIAAQGWAIVDAPGGFALRRTRG
jgi:cysteinyl-tRNA synthetase